MRWWGVFWMPICRNSPRTDMVIDQPRDRCQVLRLMTRIPAADTEYGNSNEQGELNSNLAFARPASGARLSASGAWRPRLTCRYIVMETVSLLVAPVCRNLKQLILNSMASFHPLNSISSVQWSLYVSRLIVAGRF